MVVYQAAGGENSGGQLPTGGDEGLGNTIPISNVWVDGEKNSAGIQGRFFILEDGVKDGATLSDGLPHSDFTADVDPLEDAGVSKFSDTSTPCISGTAAMVMAADGVTECGFAAGDEECNFDSTWGGGIGLYLGQTREDAGTKIPFNAVTAGITGFKFNVTGDVGGAMVRFKAVPAGVTTDFCKPITVEIPGDVSVHISDVMSECWADTGIPVDATALESIQWQIVTDNLGSHVVTNFCVNSLEWF